jgi:hypothetical protein
MPDTHPVVNSSPPTNQGSVLGSIVAGASCLGELLAIIVLACARAEVLAELAALRAHKLFEFAPYKSAPVTRNDEPLFAKRTLVKHRTKGVGTLLRIVENRNGNPVFVVQFADEECTLTAYWLTLLEGPIDDLIEEWWLRKVEEFTFSDASPATTDKPRARFSRCMECGEEFVDGDGEPTISEFAFCDESLLQQGDCKREWLKGHLPACELPKQEPKSVDAVTAHSEGEYQAKWTAPFTHSRVSNTNRKLTRRSCLQRLQPIVRRIKSR